MESKFKKLVALIEESGNLARDYFYNEERFFQKDDKTLVTEVDTKIEDMLRTFVAEHFPDDTIVGEEGEDVIGNSGYVWYIDPIDGTENFVRKIPLFSITATRLGSGPEGSMAIVHNPISQQTFASFMGQGIYENQKLTTFSDKPAHTRQAIHVVSNPAEPWVKPAKHHLIHQLGKKYGRSASFSTGILEMAYVAAGRLDGVLSLLNKPWDSAAGLYLNKASGADISLFSDNAWSKYEGAIKDLYGESLRDRKIILMSHPAIHEELCAFIGDPKQWAE